MNPFFNKDEPVETFLGGLLPHWHQDEKIQYVTFRLADSLPQSKITELRLAISSFNEAHPKPWDKSAIQRYWQIVGAKEEELLDNGYGECILQRPEIRKIVSSSIWFNSSKLYDNQYLDDILRGLKGFTANAINNYLQRTGRVWMTSYFDRIVRSERHLQKYISYIENNPRNFSSDMFELYVNPNYKR